jgi:prevent-host-death family protein
MDFLLATTFQYTEFNLSLTRKDVVTSTVDIDEAKIHLSHLVDEVAADAEIIITTAAKPMARLSPRCQMTSTHPWTMSYERSFKRAAS